MTVFLSDVGARGQQKAQRMGIIHRNQVYGLRTRFNMLISPSGVVEVEVSMYNVVNRGILERKMKQRKYILSIRGDRKAVKKTGNSRLGASWSVNVVDYNIPSTVRRALKTRSA